MRSSAPTTWLTPTRAPRPRVLCVDDDVNVVFTIRRILGGRFDVTPAVGGRAGLEAVRTAAEPFAVVVSDIRMPDLPGIALMKMLRELAPDTVRILLTAYPDRESTIAAIEQGEVFRILVKPCAPDRLISTVAAAVEQHQRHG